MAKIKVNLGTPASPEWVTINQYASDGVNSHAEGYGSNARGDGAHAEGWFTSAESQASHTEGFGTKVSTPEIPRGVLVNTDLLSPNNYLVSVGHAEGFDTLVTGPAGHAEGMSTIASGETSHAEGYSSTASGISSHAEGDSTTASGSNSHAEGYATMASGENSHTEGNITTASGKNSHAEGDHTTAFGIGSHAEGHSTNANGDFSHSEGSYSTAETPYTHAEGENTLAVLAEVITNISGYNAANKTITVESSANFLVGKNIIIRVSSSRPVRDKIAAINGNVITLTSNTPTASYMQLILARTMNFSPVHAEGQYTLATGEASHAEGYNTTARGRYSHVEGSSTIALGEGSHAEGNYTTARGDGTHAEGYLTLATGHYSHAEGELSRAFSPHSHAEGYGTVAGGAISPYNTKITIASYTNNPSSITINELISSKINDYLLIEISSGSYNVVKILDKTTSGTTTTLTIDSSPSSTWLSLYEFTGYYGMAHAEGKYTMALGGASHAEGLTTIASGFVSHAEGGNTKATGEYAHAEGYNTVAYGNTSHAQGTASKTFSTSAHAEGYGTKAGSYSDLNQGHVNITAFNGASRTITVTSASDYSVGEHILVYIQPASLGYTDVIATQIVSISSNVITVSNEDYPAADWKWIRKFEQSLNGHYGTAHAEGDGSMAFGQISHAEGNHTKALGSASHSEGNFTVASGDSSHSSGNNTIANTFASTAIGSYNKNLTGYANAYSATADAFVIGNGTWSAKSNAFRVTFNGAVYGLSAFNSSGADYAEYFEWSDGNTHDEDRVGFFVTMDGANKIRKATSEDSYIVGIISGSPSVIGDSHQDDWHGKYITDEWGRIQYETVSTPEEKEIINHEAIYETVYIQPVRNESGEIIKEGREEQILIKEAYDEEIVYRPTGEEYLPKINPQWNSESEYIPREQRKEWDAVGMMGKLLVRDDGTCQVGGFCKVTDGGIATSSQTGYYVMRRVTENNIQVIFK